MSSDRAGKASPRAVVALPAYGLFCGSYAGVLS